MFLFLSEKLEASVPVPAEWEDSLARRQIGTGRRSLGHPKSEVPNP